MGILKISFGFSFQVPSSNISTFGPFFIVPSPITFTSWGKEKEHINTSNKVFLRTDFPIMRYHFPFFWFILSKTFPNTVHTEHQHLNAKKIVCHLFLLVLLNRLNVLQKTLVVQFIVTIQKNNEGYFLYY